MHNRAYLLLITFHSILVAQTDSPVLASLAASCFVESYPAVLELISRQPLCVSFQDSMGGSPNDIRISDMRPTLVEPPMYKPKVVLLGKDKKGTVIYCECTALLKHAVQSQTSGTRKQGGTQ